jgi:hypothetical protein
VKFDRRAALGTAYAALALQEVTTMESEVCAQHEGEHPHVHAEEACGHEYIRHDGHVDYEHAGHWHAKHADHWDEHPGPEGANPAVS